VYVKLRSAKASANQKVSIQKDLGGGKTVFVDRMGNKQTMDSREKLLNHGNSWKKEKELHHHHRTEKKNQPQGKTGVWERKSVLTVKKGKRVLEEGPRHSEQVTQKREKGIAWLVKGRQQEKTTEDVGLGGQKEVVMVRRNQT